MSARTLLPRCLPPLVVVACLAACSSIPSGTDWKSERRYGAEMARAGFWKEALFRFEKAAAQKPDDARTQNDLAVAYESIGETARALDAYKKALALDPGDPHIKRNYARFAEYYTSVQRASGLLSAPPPGQSPTPTPTETPAPAATPETAPAQTPAPAAAPPAPATPVPTP